MSKEIEVLDKRPYYSLPFEKDSRKLSLHTVDKHSDFRFPDRPYLIVKRRTISFIGEVLTVGIRLGNEQEERVYLRVTETELRVSCSVDTDQSYISRYSYFVLHSFTHVSGYGDFSKFYWPDFFDRKTGKSKYLIVIIDRLGIDITVRAEYPFFYKPGYELIYPSKNENLTNPQRLSLEKDHLNQLNTYAIGYCLADTHLSSSRAPHLPFIVRYAGIWKDNQREIKGFHQFIMTTDQAGDFDYTPTQDKLNSLCEQMQTLAPIQNPEYSSSDFEKQVVKMKTLNTLNEIYGLWKIALPLLQTQPFTHSLYTYGLRNIKGKPRKSDMEACTYSPERPQLCFILTGKGEYYQLEMRFKADGKVYIPNASNPTFFIHSTTNPQHFYFLDSITDYDVVRYFEQKRYKIAVLKCHYQGRFKAFVDLLAKTYQLKTKGITSHEKEDHL